MASDNESTVEVREARDTEEYDAQAAARGLCDKACDIKSLLHGHVESTRALERVVGEFCTRDIAEEDAFRKISLDVMHAEMRALRDLHYVAFSQRWAEVEKGSAAEEVTSLPSADRSVGSCVSHLLASLCEGKPDATFSLSEYFGVADVLMEWRSLTPASQEQLDILLLSITRSVEDISSCVLLLNGVLYTPSDSFDCCELTRRELTAIIGSGGPASAEEALVGWLNFIVRRSLLNQTLLQRLMSSTIEFRRSDLCLQGDGADVLVVVDHRRLLNSAVFRGFFFSGELRGVEAIGAQVNLMSVLFAGNGSGDQLDIEKCIADIFRALWEQQELLSCKWKNVTVTLAVQARKDVGAGAQTKLMDFVVLDLRPLSPNIPFQWHFTWGEVCALGQLSTNDGDRARPLDIPVFKTTRVAVASLGPYDKLSRIMFPSINEYLRLTRKEPPSVAPVAYAVVVAALVVGGFIVGSCILGSRRRR
ncbi:hypothetical protein, conserved [Trypanosoma brucei gambiense DAL972]|uniref:Transmembrane protein n=1 Tax=Trypanosoma brucei gambiense (strain MHOM/CI/86/DAL972) TaxID=679716 RepID=C9ZP51_TRYB9|nr:hypothetical protein, conserved [Trypanosoma brucei gambiense DAL972]CBH11179.1 hypothetical protein, conserved [Trypanosoma brucei gambiense DAL972]|eukprot:XP_011773466.1 hypothetical protein, conserved [Trypanosoma brucei gambiense DAL972]